MNRGPKPDRDLDALIASVAESLTRLGHEASNARIAVVVSYLRDVHVSRFAVRDRRKRAAARASREA